MQPQYHCAVYPQAHIFPYSIGFVNHTDARARKLNKTDIVRCDPG